MKKLGLLLIIVLLFALMLPVTAAFAEENTEIEEVVIILTIQICP